MQTPVPILFARSDSHYKGLPGADVWDETRDARRWPGGSPLVAHPPCRLWGRLRLFTKGTQEEKAQEKALALQAVEWVQQYGGVLEHPRYSHLWNRAYLPKPGEFPDEFGGWTLEVDQFQWGHRAWKPTWLYIVGCEPWDLPPIPSRPGAPTRSIRWGRKETHVPTLPKPEREHTPPDFGLWLMEVARRCSLSNGFWGYRESRPAEPANG